MFLLPILTKTKDSSGFQVCSSKLNFSESVRRDIFSMISWMSLECFEVNGISCSMSSGMFEEEE